MIGSIVFCWTLANIRSTTCPPRRIRPSTGGLSFASVPRPGPPASRRRRPRRPPFRRRPARPPASGRPRARGATPLPPAEGAPRSAPFCDGGRPPLVAGQDVDLVDLPLASQGRGGGPGRQAVPQLLGHELRVRAGEAQLLG